MPADAWPIVEAAPAKLNLDLYVERRRPDGYHDLDSVVAFTTFGDTLRFAPAPTFEVILRGPLAATLAAAGESLVQRAATALAQALDRPLQVRIELTKRIPLAAGLGGGSADAAATLRGLSRLWAADLPPARLQDLARDLGADVPVCLVGEPRTMRGIGDRLAPAPALPALELVLVNPGLPAPTAQVYRALHPEDLGPPPPRRGDWLVAGRNALEPAARRVEPAIGRVVHVLREAGAPIVRLCGSGATVFAGLTDGPAADSLARAVRAAEPGWWVERTRLAR